MADNDRHPIYVTKSFLPPRSEYDALLDEVWASDQLTNSGPLTERFVRQVSGYLGVDEEKFNYVSNGTLALQLALDALGVDSGEVITTPFTYVATTSAILWQRCAPVYVDIDPTTLTIDATKIEQAITKNTKAILAVHVFGNPCDVDAIQQIADKYNLKVIYDAAHAFGVTYKGRSILEYGDISTLSFHATKLFHTIEGGAIYSRDKKVAEKVELAKRFGHNGDTHIQLGINAKANEFQAAMGIANLKHVDQIIRDREKVHQRYDAVLSRRVQCPIWRSDSSRNYAYYPILMKDEQHLLEVIENLKKLDIHPRRYFFPSLNKLPYVNNANDCPISEDIASRILCLPFYPGLSEDAINDISKAIKQNA